MSKVMDFVIQKIGDLTLEEASLLCGARQKVEYLKLEMTGIGSLLREVESRKMILEDENMKTWVKQVRELAYDMEDCIDLFICKLAKAPQHQGRLGFLFKGIFFTKTIKERYRIGVHVRQIKAKAKMVAEIRSKYNLETENRISLAPPSTPQFGRDPELVGVDDARDNLTQLLKGENTTEQLAVISVVGMPTIGKTALAWKIYSDPAVSTHFEVHTWILVSQFGSTFLLQNLIHKLCWECKTHAPDQITEYNHDQLIRTVWDQLSGKRYLVVLDDVRDDKRWNTIKDAFPRESRGSRIMVTTRSYDIAASCKITPDSSCCIHKLNPLSPEHSWILFCRTAFHSNTERSCPDNLKELSEKIVKRCGGIAAAIKAVGSVLAKKTNQVSIEWLRMHEKLISEPSSNHVLEDVERILAASYDDLRHELRPCFLCLGIYQMIRSARLFRIWIAEGLVSDEEEARDNLEELIDRNMVNVVDTDSLGRPKCCEVNEVMHRMIVNQCKEENFAILFNLKRQNEMIGEKIRRISIYSGCLNALTNTPLYDRLRSLIVTLNAPHIHHSQTTPVSKVVFKPSRFRMLRVVDLEGVYIGCNSLDFGNYSSPLLKYLSLRNTRALSLPNSLQKFSNLQTLDIRGTFICKLPSQIVNLRRLRHLLLPVPPFNANCPAKLPLSIQWDEHSILSGVELPPGIKNLQQLEELSLVDASSANNMMTELSELKRLKNLGLRSLTEGDCREVVPAINNNMGSLVSLALLSKDKDETLMLKKLRHNPPKLQRLFLGGRLDGTDWLVSLNSIVEIELVGSHLTDDPLVTLQYLPDLMLLSLVDAYNGTELNVGPKGFPKLKTLLVIKFLNLTNVTVADTGMPSLQKLFISSCPHLLLLNLSREHQSYLELDHSGSLRVVVNSISQHRQGVEQILKPSARNKEPVSRDHHLWASQMEIEEIRENGGDGASSSSGTKRFARARKEEIELRQRSSQLSEAPLEQLHGQRQTHALCMEMLKEAKRALEEEREKMINDMKQERAQFQSLIREEMANVLVTAGAVLRPHSGHLPEDRSKIPNQVQREKSIPNNPRHTSQHMQEVSENQFVGERDYEVGQEKG